MKRISLLYFSGLMILLLFTTLSLHAQPDRITGEPFATRSEVIAQNGMVATSQPLATQIGLQILKNGGYQGIMRKDSVYYGGSESRKDGHAAGY